MWILNAIALVAVIGFLVFFLRVYGSAMGQLFYTLLSSCQTLGMAAVVLLWQVFKSAGMAVAVAALIYLILHLAGAPAKPLQYLTALGGGTCFVYCLFRSLTDTAANLYWSMKHDFKKLLRSRH